MASPSTSMIIGSESRSTTAKTKRSTTAATTGWVRNDNSAGGSFNTPSTNRYSSPRVGAGWYIRKPPLSRRFLEWIRMCPPSSSTVSSGRLRVLVSRSRADRPSPQRTSVSLIRRKLASGPNSPRCCPHDAKFPGSSRAGRARDPRSAPGKCTRLCAADIHRVRPVTTCPARKTNNHGPEQECCCRQRQS